MRLNGIDEKLARIDKRTEAMWSTQQRFIGVLGIAAFVLPVLVTVALRVWLP